MAKEFSGRFPCGQAWDHRGHVMVHVCRETVVLFHDGVRLVSSPHKGDHVCKCGERKPQ